jgi:methylmalonyl-CoA mutase N-terminal domain/subunit
MGGSVAAIESGWMQSEIANAAWAYQQDVDTGKEVIVGVNRYRSDAEERQPIFRVDPRLAAAQRERLAAARRTRDPQAVATALAALRRAAEGTDNLMPPIIDAVKSYATLGEICGVMRDVFGDYRPPTAV